LAKPAFRIALLFTSKGRDIFTMKLLQAFLGCIEPRPYTSADMGGAEKPQMIDIL